jgi:hypothetical protein
VQVGYLKAVGFGVGYLKAVGSSRKIVGRVGGLGGPLGALEPSKKAGGHGRGPTFLDGLQPPGAAPPQPTHKFLARLPSSTQVG